MKLKITYWITLAGLALMVMMDGCYYDNAKDLYPSDTLFIDSLDTVTYSWSSDVQPVINTNCAVSGCHAAGNGSGRQPLSTYDEVKNAIENYSLYTRVESGSMPPGGNLSTTDKNAILGWIDQNYPNN